MEFTFINIFAMMIDSLIVIPEMVHSIKGINKRYSGNAIIPVFNLVLKYSCIILMFLPLGVNKFGFSSVFVMLVYVISNVILVLVYDVMFIINVKNDSLRKDRILLYIEMAIYVISGMCLNHLFLIMLAIGYAALHYKLIDGYSDQYSSR